MANTYQVGGYIWQLDMIPVAALNNPLTDQWDHVPCPVCDVSFYRLGIDKHLTTHRYQRPMWIRLLRWVVNG